MSVSTTPVPVTSVGPVYSQPLEDGYRLMVFLHKILILNDTSGSFITVFRPSYLKGSIYTTMFCMDIVLEVIGIMGNITSVYVLAHRALRSSTSLLLSSMAVYDSVFLLTILATMLNEIFNDFPYYSPSQAAAVNTVLQISGMASTCTMVAVTVERYIAVRRPIRARMFCTASVALKAIMLIVSLASISSIPRILQIYRADDNVTSEFKDCAHSSDKSMLHLIYCSMFPIIFVLIIPFMIISVLNVSILRGLIRRGLSLKNLGRTSTLLKGDSLTIATLGTSSFFFLCCTFPAIYFTIDGMRPDITHPMGDIVSDICSSLVILNFSANFLFYCILGQAFRATLLERVCCRSKPLNNQRQLENSQRTRFYFERTTSN